MNIRKDVADGIRAIVEESKQVELRKRNSAERQRAFLAERRASSPVQKRIDALRGSIQRKQRSDQ